MNQLYGTFCRVWAAGGQATFSTTSLEGIVTAKLEVKLGQPTRARPGAPPPHLRTAEAFAAQHQAPASGAARRPRHRGPSAKAKSRARAAAYQAAKAAAAAAQESESKSTPATPGPGEAPSTPAPNAPLASSKPLNVLPSPPASDGQRLVVSVGKGERLPSFSQLDGQNDAISSASSSAEVEDDIPLLVMGGVRGADCSFSKRYATPPARVRHPVRGLSRFDEARRDRKDVYMYVNAKSDYTWVSKPD